MAQKRFAKAYAKINWTLEVLGTRSDGYHELRSVVLPVALHDDLTFESDSDGGIVISGCDGVELKENLIYKAAVALADRAGIGRPSVRISVVKRIPSGAGLGGGSADAAVALRVLNELWSVGLDEEALLELAAAVGSDVSALLLGAPVLMEGRGERVRRLAKSEIAAVPDADDIELLIPNVFASTPAVYREFRNEDRGKGRNDLEPAALRLYPAIADAMAELRNRGLSDVAMSGSGSAVYGIR